MSTRSCLRLAAAALVSLMVPIAALAQPPGTVFGTFQWQSQPYCNIVTLTLKHTPAGFTLDGTDNQCAAANKASAVGVASFNAAGNLTMNFTVVTAPSGKPVHLSAIVNTVDGNGTWTDSVGNSGTFAFAGATPGLPPRPLPASGLPPSIITTTEIAAGAVGASDINTAEVQARVTGTCPAGQAVAGVNANGTVTCLTGADQAGSTKEVAFTFAGVPAAGTAPNQLASLSFTAPASGVAVLESRGYCNVGQTGSFVELNIALGTDATTAFTTLVNPVSRWGVLQIAPGTGNSHQLMWTTRNIVNVVAATAYTRGLFGRHPSGAQADDCSGTLSVSFFPSVLP